MSERPLLAESVVSRVEWLAAVADLLADEADLVRTLRGDRSQHELAKASGVSRNVIANVESGRQKLYVHQLAALVSGFPEQGNTSDRNAASGAADA